MFIRIKKIKAKPYAYLVQSKWNKKTKKKRQKVKKYLGPLITLPYKEKPKHISSITQAIQRELHNLNFIQTSKHIFKHKNITINLKTNKVTKNKPIAIKCNDGYICNHTLKELQNTHKKQETKPGQNLAKALTNAGINLTQEEFIDIYTTLKRTPKTQKSMSIQDQLTKTLQDQLNKAIQLEIPPNQDFGDYAIHAYKLKISPQELQNTLKLPDFIETTNIQGPYLNFFIKQEILIKEAITNTTKPKAQNKTIIFEYPSPNTNKPLHLGHIRNIVTGQALVGLKRTTGNKIIEVDLRNNRGIAVCKSMLAYQRWGNNEQPDRKPDHFVGKYYIKFAQEAKKNPDLEKEAQILLQKYEQGDKEVKALWKKMDAWVQEGIEQSYKQFHLEFAKVYKESDVYEEGTRIVKREAKKGTFTIDDKTGAIIAKLEPELPDKVVLRSDGTAIYMTQDIALAIQKYNDFKADESIVLTATEQNLHFKQLAKIMQMLGYTYTNSHIGYGMVHLPEGKMKSREGTVIDADDFIKEITDLAKVEIIARHTKVDDLEDRAKAIALGAIRFYMLKVDTHKDITYNPKESLAFEGETGPYIQYTHARASSILAKQQPQEPVEYTQLSQPKEKRIAQILNQKLGTIEKAAQNNKPATIARFCLDLAQAFNEYYHAHQILTEDKKQTNARLALTKKVQQTLKDMLHLLHIEAPTAM